MKRFYIDAPVVVTSALVLTATDVTASRLSIDASCLLQSNSSMFAAFGSVNSRSHTLVQSAEEPKIWKAEYNQRFEKLSRKEARDELTVAELAELEELTKLKRAKKSPRTADEILWHRKQQALTDSLLESLKKYVEFHEVTDTA